MSEILALIIGLIIGGWIFGSFILEHNDVVLVNYNSDGSKWINHEGKKYDLAEREGGGE